MHDDGGFVVAWASFGQDGDAYGIFGERFSAGTVLCPNSPRSLEECHSAGRSTLLLKDKDGSADAVKWTFLKGDETTIDDLGDPLIDTGYAFCIYEDGVLVKAMTVLPGGTCAAKPCWKANGTVGFSYRDKELDPEGATGGLSKLQVRSGSAGKSRAKVQGKGSSVFPEAVLPFGESATVTAQLLNGANGCWASEYSGSDVRRNDVEIYKATK
jgi:hypothetical protein